MMIKGVIFDMDGTITAPHFDFVKIKEEAGIGDVDMLDYFARLLVRAGMLLYWLSESDNVAWLELFFDN